MNKNSEIKDAASVILIRNSKSNPSVLMGQRGKNASFMPNKFVFPGGAVEKNDFQVNSEMMNLLGSSKENFYELLNLMNYRKKDKEKDTFFYIGSKKNKRKNRFMNKINNKDNPFQKLQALNVK